MKYRVRIEYIEPSYAKHTGHPPKVYRATVEVQAPDESHARRVAMSEFRRLEKLSSVGWVREPVAMHVETLGTEVTTTLRLVTLADGGD